MLQNHLPQGSSKMDGKSQHVYVVNRTNFSLAGVATLDYVAPVTPTEHCFTVG